MAENDDAGNGGHDDDITEDDARQLLGVDGDAPQRGASDARFTQADLDRIIADRIARTEKKYADYGDLKSKAEKLAELEKANQSAEERLSGERDTFKSRAEKAEAALKRREIAEARAPEHATSAQIKAVAKRLAGESDDDLEADADELFALLAPAPEAKPKTPSRPRERLRGGGDPDDEPEETDPRKLAALVPRRR